MAQILLFLAVILGGPAWAIEDPIDYLPLDHTITTKTLRAGNHDASGENTYYFNVTMYGLVISKEESNKEFTERKKVEVDLGGFGDYLVKSLTYFDHKETPIEGVEITGDQLREVVSMTMQEFEIVENLVSVLVKVQMFERGKKFIFFGEDKLIGEQKYFAIPEILGRKPNTNDLLLEIFDDFGTLVRIDVKYQLNSKLAGKK